eukprot:CAMPEP_0172551350 /NCGR_PEP_ID=MMETSP1067-20121228/38468_1 /TAXON_ID=265564 ORGANISM="Thalassiosira punctigera, Strain Tpunct2005C2" /NCGR_SAMPLE_ID=MMETSP1067 /ASSEMBLY_ACC=CAM_ASM_000444 /LENGTH=88 /DNA_ID=CAMNT_0013339133 /DNA_START=67 /DNA_END=330 /DNA_ORIENTATION=+
MKILTFALFASSAVSALANLFGSDPPCDVDAECDAVGVVANCVGGLCKRVPCDTYEDCGVNVVGVNAISPTPTQPPVLPPTPPPTPAP